ncbi:MAG: ATP-grasp domain-containing protein [Rhodospirillales bacterium]|nr:MAG: ATP-grasp domain-containing protein [Rhodospirillales bacterium]
MKRALILGTGAAQVDAIRHLKKHGWWVAGCSYRREGPGLTLVDRFLLIDIADVDGLATAARENDVNLIYSVGSDLAMPTVAMVAKRLGLGRLIEPETATLLQDKARLRDFLARHQISPVAYRVVSDAGDIDGWDHFPAIIKPTDSQGQRGVFQVESRAEAKERLSAALAASRGGQVILEERLDGPEVSANVFVLDGRVVVNEISDRLVVADFPGGIPRGHVIPAQSAPAPVLAQARALVEQCVGALGITNGPAYFQMKLTVSGPRIIEITPRLDGCHLWRLLRHTHGVDLLDASFRILAGEPVADAITPRSRIEGCSLMFFLQPPGEVFQRADHPAPAEALHTEYYLDDGQVVPPVNGYLEKVGYTICRGQP